MTFDMFEQNENGISLVDVAEYVTERGLLHLDKDKSYCVDVVQNPIGYETFEKMKSRKMQPCDNIEFTLYKVLGEDKGKKILNSLNNKLAEKYSECIGGNCYISDKVLHDGIKNSEDLCGMCPRIGAIASDLTKSFGKVTAEQLMIKTAFEQYTEKNQENIKTIKVENTSNFTSKKPREMHKVVSAQCKNY